MSMARWANTKTKTTTESKQRSLMATPPDPNRCFVLFSTTYRTLGSVAVSLESLLSQVRKKGAERTWKRIRYSEDDGRFEIELEPVEGGESS